jgi:preprotein translocase subunit SecA
MKMLSRQLEAAQTRIEGFHFDARKQILAYDDVLNQQRIIAYSRRHKLLHGDEAETKAVLAEVLVDFPAVAEMVEKKQAEFGEVEFLSLFRRLALQIHDLLWVEHLEVMGYTRTSVNLRAYGQRDPLIEYRKEAVQLFAQMQRAILERIAAALPVLQPAVIAKEEAEQQQEAAAAIASSQTTSRSQKGKTVVSQSKIGRNDMVTITNGSKTETMKFKKAEPLLTSGWSLVSK